MNAAAGWVERIRSGDRRAIARAITAVENATAQGRALVAQLAGSGGRARVIGITGPPGAGKSTLVNALVKELIARGHTVGVLAVDPSSPITGGAVLGDRIRMAEVHAERRVFIRSLATRGHLGGLTRTTKGVVDVLDAAGFDYVIVETVGTGQSEVEITGIAGTRVVVCPPGLGDDVQALKAGVLEIADVFVVNKADLPGAGRIERELRSMLALRRAECRPAVLKTVATSGDGVAALADEVTRHAASAARLMEITSKPPRALKLVRSQQIEWQPLDEPGVSGVFVKVLRFDDETQRAPTILLRFEPGAMYPAHNHPGGEEIFVIEGDIKLGRDHLSAGDYLYMAPDNKHAARSENGCVVLVACTGKSKS